MPSTKRFISPTGRLVPSEPEMQDLRNQLPRIRQETRDLRVARALRSADFSHIEARIAQSLPGLLPGLYGQR
jgi:hypothetical protein